MSVPPDPDEIPLARLQELARIMQVKGRSSRDRDELILAIREHLIAQAHADAASAAHDRQNSASAARLAGLHQPPLITPDLT